MAEKIQEAVGMKNSRLFETQIFLTKLLVLSVPLYLVLWLGIDMGFLQEITASSVVSGLEILGISCERAGFEINSNGFLFHISKDCTGWKGMMFLFSLILATKSSWRKKLIGLGTTLPAFFSFNMLRIIFMVWIGVNYQGMFELLHDFVWQFSMVAVVVFLWLIWSGLKINSSGSKKNHVDQSRQKEGIQKKFS